MSEPEVHKRKYYDQVEVFGSMEKRSWSEVPASSPIKCSINEPNCPVRNPFDNIDGVMREEGIKLFDNLVWQSWYEDGNMPKEAKEWFVARVKEFKAGKDIDLICNCRRFRGQDDDVGILAKYPCDCHGYTLKKYIEFIADKSNICY
tara:strand:+ start:249 stop:689 length:441 start_codon:yes stop_codon:yes gene_type:complete